jgi:diguanylate cyclase (GGDEF)-like protein
MPLRAIRRTVIRAYEGLALALVVPLAWLFAHDLLHGIAPLDDIALHPWFFVATLGATAVGYGLIGYLVGRREEHLHTANARLERLSKTDKLTGLPNRRDFDDNLEREVSTSDRTETPLALVIFDLDHFKRVNDSHGHLAGDALLQMIAATLIEGRRKQDFTARIGGEEFGMILPGLELEQARLVAERCLSSVRQVAFYWNGRRIPMTVSAGVAALVPKEPPVHLLARADKALYAAKGAGRDKVEVA